ncbi:putative pumilio homolog 8, chloroplastic [Medicago truncatula]|nr:putative pumilio homolog 8, chloroplastic [Medicago truncatula]
MAKYYGNCLVVDWTLIDIDTMFNEVIGDVVKQTLDPFMSNIVQHVLEFGRDDQRLKIVRKLTQHPDQLVEASLDSYGTKCVQKLISTHNSKKEIALVSYSLLSGFLYLVMDLDGNQVLQRCLSCWSVEDNEFIYDAATRFCYAVATDEHGCCLLQRCIEFSNGNSQQKLVKEICKYAFHLAQHEYGNHIVQYIIQMQNPSAIAELTAQFNGKYVQLSMQKFSIHVVEKCLEHIVETRARIVQEFLAVPYFENLLQDPYANYVVQCALKFTECSVSDRAQILEQSSESYPTDNVKREREEKDTKQLYRFLPQSGSSHVPLAIIKVFDARISNLRDNREQKASKDAHFIFGDSGIGILRETRHNYKSWSEDGKVLKKSCDIQEEVRECH